MRISDWSSDVCSSDLDIGLGEEAEDLRQQVAFVIGELLRPVAAILAQGHFFGHPVDLLLALPEIIGPGIFEGLVLLAGFGEGHGAYSRSEEHTSELQSLMRISYAVFCLKKKKKKNTR